MDVLPAELIDAPAAPPTPAQETFRLAHPPRRGQQQSEGQVGRRLRQHVRCIGNGDTAPRRRFDVDIVEADGDIGDDFQRRQGRHHFVGEAIGQLADDAVLAGELLQQILRRVALVGIVIFDLGSLAKVFHRFGINAFRDQ